MSIAASAITIYAKDRASRDEQLEQAISLLLQQATHCGILVTRIEPNTFTIALCPDVPFGLTQEADLL